MDVSVTAQKQKAAPRGEAIVPRCTIESPPGSGCRCGERSHNGQATRCLAHKDSDEVPDIPGFKSRSVIRASSRRRKRGCSRHALQYIMTE